MSQSPSPRLPNYLFLWVIASMAVALVAEAEEPDNIFFHEHYKAAIQEAKLTRKPIFLEFRCAP